jgi:hypothetical protein
MRGMNRDIHARNEADWKVMRAKLERLSVDELKELAERVGVKFSEGTDSMKDRPQASVKEQLLLVLDESAPDELEREYRRIIKE